MFFACMSKSKLSRSERLCPTTTSHPCAPVPLTACVNNGSILESCLWLGPEQWCGFPTRGGGGGDGRGWWSGNSSAWAGSTLVGPLCQPHLPLTARTTQCTTLPETSARVIHPKEVRFKLPPFTVIPPRRWHGGEAAAFSKNWTGATAHLKREASEPGTEKKKQKKKRWSCPGICLHVNVC